jgi:hypothetical protein
LNFAQFHFVNMPDIFENRMEAAKILASSLLEYKGRNPLILAIPRGAVSIGSVIAKSRDGELDVVLVHKLGSPLVPNLRPAPSTKPDGHTWRRLRRNLGQAAVFSRKKNGGGSNS